MDHDHLIIPANRSPHPPFSRHQCMERRATLACRDLHPIKAPGVPVLVEGPNSLCAGGT